MFKYIFLFILSIQSIIALDITIGKYDRVDLPIFNLQDIKAKIDTGAKTSSLHCSFIKQIDEKTVSFEVLDSRHKKYIKKIYTLPITRIASVRSSNGHIENRYVISIKTIIFNKTFDIEYTLRNREMMNYPILLGREFLQKGFIVDVRKEDLSFNKKNK
ncbi:ATP-dependent zinc protease [Poseidonibacter sp.]|uniref:ATP-dependent zinc protease family protein n=1 Tax=Poseidonibacter sp. TaxID=2321188 RepID=UPI003C7112CE